MNLDIHVNQLAWLKNIAPQILICAPLLRATLGNSYSRCFLELKGEAI
jgi:hypothetical protein